MREVECAIPGHGMFWEADECARCIRDVSEISACHAAMRSEDFLCGYLFVREKEGC